MKLWTIQEKPLWDYLQKNKIVYATKEWADPDFIKSYDWLIEQMKKRIGEPPIEGIYPIWAWYQWGGINRKKPDLRHFIHNCKKGKRFVRLEIKIPDNQVLLSDFLTWHLVLNNYKPKLWGKMFDLTFENEEYTYLYNEKKIQATFWELRLEQVVKVTEFVGKRENNINTI